MDKLQAWLKNGTLWLMALQVVVGTVIPCLGLWLIYVNLNAMRPYSGGVVVGVLLLLYGYLATRPAGRKSP